MTETVPLAGQPLLPSAPFIDVQPAATPAPGQPVTILLLGHDQRPDEYTVTRTDAIMLVRIDPKSQRVATLSLPRDLWVDIPGYGYNRINTAYQTGEVYGGRGYGLHLAAQTVYQLLGLRIDYVFLIGFDGFTNLIDQIGGITVNVEKELYDTEFPTMDYGYTTVHFLPGPQYMDGTTALIYSRIRHPDSDFERIQRQQAVIIGIAARLRERGDLENLLAADQLTSALRDFVRTDMPKDRILDMVWAMRNLDVTSIQRFVLTPDSVVAGVGNDTFALVPSPAALNRLVQQFLGNE